ncbi:MAG: AAA family ATPase [Beijerinckiaceae bacterium]
MDRFVVISGCSGAGKSSLLVALAALGFSTVEEPGRRIVRSATAADDQTLPWVDGVSFARRAVELALDDRKTASNMAGKVFFDRGLVDACAALDHLTGERTLETLGLTHRYDRTVFLTPPWRAIFASDAERRHGFAEAVEEHDRLVAAYHDLGYELITLPKTTVQERADFMLDALGLEGWTGRPS